LLSYASGGIQSSIGLLLLVSTGGGRDD